MKENINALDELNKGASMGMDAIHFILDKVEDDDFKKTLEIEYNKYKDISRRANELYSEYSDGEAHETKRDETGDGGDRRANDGGESFINRGGHGLFAVRFSFLFLFVTVPKENRIVHGHGKLQNGGQGLRDKRNFAEENIGAKI